MNLFTNPNICMQWITILASFGILISALESLYLRHLFQNDALLAWPSLKNRRFLTSKNSPLSTVLDRLSAYPNVLFLWTLRTLSALFLIFFFHVAVLWFTGLFIIYGSHILLFRFRQTATSGAEDMGQIVFGALFFSQVVASGTLATEACLWFIALQACLAYFGNSKTKLKDPAWRRGEVVYKVTKHNLFGYAPAARFLRQYPIYWQMVHLVCCHHGITFPIGIDHWPSCMLDLFRVGNTLSRNQCILYEA